MASHPRKTPAKKATTKKAPAKLVAPVRPPLRTFSPARRAAPTHLFAVGQTVRLRGGISIVPTSAEIYRVTATLPPRGDLLQYRIRNEEERYERVTTQDNLEPVALPTQSDGSALIERTFGHGQGTAA
jgi:hypothetical protein